MAAKEKSIIKLRESGQVAGVKFPFNTFAFYRSPPIPIQIMIGYDRPMDREFLYIEVRDEVDADYASPEWQDGCVYNSVSDAFLGDPVLLRYLEIFIKYKIFIPIEIYEIFQDIAYCSPENKIGYFGRVKDVSKEAHKHYKQDLSGYYNAFSSVITGMPYRHPLTREPRNGFEEFYEVLDEFKNEPRMDDYSAPYASESVVGGSQQSDIKIESKKALKNRLTLGEGDFSFAVALCKKHPEIRKKIIVSEYRSKTELEKCYKDMGIFLISGNIHKAVHLIPDFSIVLVHQKFNYFKAFYVKNKQYVTHKKTGSIFVKNITFFDSEMKWLMPCKQTRKIIRTPQNSEVIDVLLVKLTETSPFYYRKSFSSHEMALIKAGVEMHYGIDAQKINTTYKGGHFKRIHFNCPNIPTDPKEREIAKMLFNFFRSATSLQKIDDKILIALPKPSKKEERDNRSSYLYKIYDSAAESGYKFVEKRKFDKKRYPEYCHAKTNEAKSADVAKEIREYVFRRIEPFAKDSLESIYYKSPAELKEHYIGRTEKEGHDIGHILPEEDLRTSDDSSNYDSSSDLDSMEILSDDFLEEELPHSDSFTPLTMPKKPSKKELKESMMGLFAFWKSRHNQPDKMAGELKNAERSYPETLVPNFDM